MRREITYNNEVNEQLIKLRYMATNKKPYIKIVGDTTWIYHLGKLIDISHLNNTEYVELYMSMLDITKPSPTFTQSDEKHNDKQATNNCIKSI